MSFIDFMALPLFPTPVDPLPTKGNNYNNYVLSHDVCSLLNTYLYQLHNNNINMKYSYVVRYTTPPLVHMVINLNTYGKFNSSDKK